MATTTSSTQTPGSDPEATADETQTAVQRLREQADAVVERIQPRIAAVTTYVREEPTKALLISAATGAALMGLVALIVRASSSSRSTVPGQARAASLASTTMAAIRSAALDLADRAQTMAADALDSAQQRAASALDSAQQHASSALDAAKARANDALDATKKRAGDTFDASQKRASDALDDAKKRASAAADSVSGSVGDAWKSVREQAQPVVDKVKPQLDAVANYAKEDPARAALGAAAAAALVIGLVALVRRSQDD
jgi:ElaB/YqjD/DUF883 family membrane-anchored ribosome-binding protein